MAIVLLKLAAFIVLAYSFGRIVIQNCGLSKEDGQSYFLQDFVFNTITGISSHLLLSHLLSYISHSFRTSVFLSLGLMLIMTLLFGIKQKITIAKLFAKPDWFDSLAIALGLLTGILAKQHYQVFGDSARFHLALVGSIANNNVYPPIWPSNPDLSMSFYHYGLDLFIANLKIITGLNTLDIFPVHVGFTAVFGITVSFVLLRFFLKSPKLAFITTLIYLCVSVNSIEFFTTHLSQFGSLDFLQLWKGRLDFYGLGGLTQSRGAISNALTYSSLCLIIHQISRIKNASSILKGANYFTNLSILILAFMLFALKSSLWTMIFIAIAFALFIIGLMQLKEQGWKNIKAFSINSTLLLLVFYIGKILSFGNPLSDGFQGIEPMIIAPSTNWAMQGLGTLPLYFDQAYLNTLATIPDLTHGTLRPLAPLFSDITLRKFGFATIFAILIFGYQVFKKQLNSSSFLLLLAWFSAPIPFIVAFVPKPFETLRFLSYLAIYSLLYIVINLALIAQEQYQKNKTNKVIILCCLTLLTICSTPGILSIIPTKKFTKGNPGGYWLPNNAMITELEKIHQTGEILLDTEFLHLGHHGSELAGFYGVKGGQMYKSDIQTRRTAMQTLNPLLLQELQVNYVLTGPRSQISTKHKPRLQDPRLFEEILSINKASPSHHLYKFIGQTWISSLTQDQVSSLDKEYLWVIGYSKGDIQFVPYKIKGGYATAQTKEELKAATEELRSTILKSDRAMAIYTVSQAMPL